MTDEFTEIVAFVHRCLDEDEAQARAMSGNTVTGSTGNWKPSPAGDEWAASRSKDGDEAVLVALRPGLPRPPDVMGGLWGGVIASKYLYPYDDEPSMMPVFDYVAAHDPAAVIADCQAKREILRHLVVWRKDAENAVESVTRDMPIEVQGAILVSLFGAPAVIVKLLAATYQRRTGYKAEWRLDERP
jgi:hypothetical protein